MYIQVCYLSDSTPRSAEPIRFLYKSPDFHILPTDFICSSYDLCIWEHYYLLGQCANIFKDGAVSLFRKQQVPLGCWYPPSKLHGAITQQTVVFTGTEVAIQNLKQIFHIQ
jgi:hypothetical protein